MQDVRKYLLIVIGFLTFAFSCRGTAQNVPTGQLACPSSESVATILGGPVKERSNATLGLCLYESSDHRQLGAAIFSAPVDSEVWTKGLRERAEVDLRSGLAHRFSPARPVDLALWYPAQNKISVFIQSDSVLRNVVLTFENRTLDIAETSSLVDVFIDMALNAPVGAA